MSYEIIGLSTRNKQYSLNSSFDLISQQLRELQKDTENIKMLI